MKMACLKCEARFDDTEMPLGGRIIECPRCGSMVVLAAAEPREDV